MILLAIIDADNNWTMGYMLDFSLIYKWVWEVIIIRYKIVTCGTRNNQCTSPMYTFISKVFIHTYIYMYQYIYYYTVYACVWINAILNMENEE